MTPNTRVNEDIAVIKNQIINISNNFTEFKTDIRDIHGSMKKRINDVEEKQSDLEKQQAAMDQKLSLMAGFQSVFSIIVGGIATYLGMRR